MYNRFYIKTYLKQSAIDAVIVYRGIMLLRCAKVTNIHSETVILSARM